jgi:hypothetical protein
MPSKAIARPDRSPSVQSALSEQKSLGKGFTFSLKQIAGLKFARQDAQNLWRAE